MTNSNGPEVIQWFLDTRTLWKVPSHLKTARDQMQEFKSLKSESGRALALLPEAEQKKITSFMFPKDARLSLASYLMKHVLVTHLTSIPFSQTPLSSSKDLKPIFKAPTMGQKDLDFNVSHQAGLVSLIAIKSSTADVGTDITCVSERLNQTYLTIRKEKDGFGGWIDMHADVFNPREVEHMKYNHDLLNLDLRQVDGETRLNILRCLKFDDEIGSGINGTQVIVAKLRRFYAYWALREAYVKMTGEALLAPWLKELEFRHVRAPLPDTACSDDEEDLRAGEVVRDVECWFKNVRVHNVRVELRALGRSYMIADCVRDEACSNLEGLVCKGYKPLELEKDILQIAREENQQGT